MPASTMTKEVSATGAVLTKPGRLYGIVCLAGTTPTLRLFDNPSAASGTEVFPASTQVIGTPITFPPGGIPLQNGLHATVGGTVSPRFLVIVGSP